MTSQKKKLKKMETKELLREEIIETSFYLTQAVISNNVTDIERTREHLNRIIELYKKELNK